VNHRGIHALRVVMGLVGLTHHHPSSSIERACQVAQSHSAHRLRDIRNLLHRAGTTGRAGIQQQFDFVAEHPLIRPLTDYGQFVHDAFDNTPVEAKSSTL